MSDRLIRITGINSSYFVRNNNYNSYKVQPVHSIDKHGTNIQKEHQEIKDEFKRILEAEQEIQNKKHK